MKASRILVLGATGQLGLHVLKHAPAGVHIDAPPRAVLDVEESAALEAYIQALNPHFIINAAAYTAVDDCERQPAKAHAINTVAAATVAKCAQQCGAKLLHVSTDYVFDGKASRAYTPQDLCAPINEYGRSKYAGEQAVLQHNPSALVVRTAWLYSESGRNFLTRIVAAAQQNRPLTVVDDQLGSPTYAGDLAVAIWQLLQKQVAGGIYHYAGDSAVSWHDFAQRIVDTASLLSDRIAPRRITRQSTASLTLPAARPAYSVLESSSVTRLGVAPSCLIEGINASLKALFKTGV